MKTDRPDRNEAMDNLEKELSDILKDTGEHISEDYYDIFSQIFDDLKIGPSYPPVPMEVLQGIAAAFGYASGHRVVLQPEIREPVEGKSNLNGTRGRDFELDDIGDL